MGWAWTGQVEEVRPWLNNVFFSSHNVVLKNKNIFKPRVFAFLLI
jgi:hypothetical protein